MPSSYVGFYDILGYQNLLDKNEPEEIAVHCNILTEIFDTQNNIIQISKNNEILSMIFDKRKTEDSIKF